MEVFGHRLADALDHPFLPGSPGHAERIGVAVGFAREVLGLDGMAARPGGSLEQHLFLRFEPILWSVATEQQHTVAHLKTELVVRFTGFREENITARLEVDER